MITAGQILKSISPSAYQFSNAGASIEPGDDGGHLGSVAALLSWLSHSCEEEDWLSPQALNCFFRECLEYPHWQQKRKTLASETRRFIESLCRQWNEDFAFEQVQWPEQIQLIEVEHAEQCLQVVENFLRATPKDLPFRLIYDESLQKIICVQMNAEQGLDIRQFTRKFFLREGRLTPLREDLQVQYDADLELMQERTHKLETAPFTTARFFVQGEQAFGSIARGYFFQKMQSLSGQDLSTSAKLFYTLRRLEQHFIKRESDPFYQGLIENTEHCIRRIRIGDLEARAKAADLLSMAQNALEHVFIGDKLLSLLVRDLQYTMADRMAVTTAVKQKEENLWNPRKPARPSPDSLLHRNSPSPTSSAKPQPVADLKLYHRPKSDLTN